MSFTKQIQRTHSGDMADARVTLHMIGGELRATVMIGDEGFGVVVADHLSVTKTTALKNAAKAIVKGALSANGYSETA